MNKKHSLKKRPIFTDKSPLHNQNSSILLFLLFVVASVFIKTNALYSNAKIIL